MKPERTPWVTILLTATNIAAAFLMFLVHPEWAEQFGFQASHPSLRNAFLCLFLHANSAHLMGNMLALVAIGSWVEDALGHLKFLLLYLLGGLAGVALHFAVMRLAPSSAPLIGASGAAACCTAYASVRYMWSKVPFGPKLKLPVVGIAAVWAILQLLGVFIRIGDQSVVSYWSHLGGLIAGLVGAAILGAPKDASLARGRKSVREMESRSPEAVVTAAKAHLQHHPNDVPTLLQLAEAYETLGDYPAERQTRLALIAQGNSGERADQVARLAALGGLSEIPSLQRCRYAAELSITSVEASTILLRSVADGASDDPQHPEALLALATLLSENDPDQSRQALQRLRDEHPLHPATALADQRKLPR